MEHFYKQVDFIKVLKGLDTIDLAAGIITNVIGYNQRNLYLMKGGMLLVRFYQNMTELFLLAEEEFSHMNLYRKLVLMKNHLTFRFCTKPMTGIQKGTIYIHSLTFHRTETCSFSPTVIPSYST
jgi:hypothetical protein